VINREDLIKIGKWGKPHGIQGELSFAFTNDSFAETEDSFLICELDGIFVPFRMEKCRFTSGSMALIKLKTVDSESKARRLTNHDVYFPKKQIQAQKEEIYSWDYFIGFNLVDEKTGEVGIIATVDDSTPNTLFVVIKNNKEILIPAAEEMITHINETGKKIYVLLPDGLLTI